MSDAVALLAGSGSDSPRTDARVLREYAKDDAEFETFVARRVAGEPVAYIVGEKGFWSLTLDVGPGALVPRPETETLVEEALRLFPDRAAPLRVADLGTGTGAILLACLREFPNATGIGIDASADALRWAARNTKKLGCSDRVTLVTGDWSVLGGAFDLILSNPPYLTVQEWRDAPKPLTFEPRAALAAGADGLDAYRALAPLIASRLNKGGYGLLEIGQGQGQAVTALMAAQGLEVPHLVPDLSGIPRCVVTRVQENPWNGSPKPVVSSWGQGNPA